MTCVPVEVWPVLDGDVVGVTREGRQVVMVVRVDGRLEHLVLTLREAVEVMRALDLVLGEVA